MWKLELRTRNSFSGNICFEFSVFSVQLQCRGRNKKEIQFPSRCMFKSRVLLADAPSYTTRCCYYLFCVQSVKTAPTRETGRLAILENTGSSLSLNLLGRGWGGDRGWIEWKGVGVHPHPQLAGPRIPSSLNIRNKVAIASLCALWSMAPACTQCTDYLK